MEIDFIELQHRENVLKLMEICGIKMEEAYDLFINSGYNFEAALNSHFNPIANVPQPLPQHSQKLPFGNFPRQQIPQENYQIDVDSKYEEYKVFKQTGLTFEKKYTVRKHESFFKSLIPKFLKGEEEDPFLKQLQKFVGKRVNLKTNIGHLSEAFLWSYKQKFPLAIILLNFLPESQLTIKKLFSDQPFLQMINLQFQVYGLNVLQSEIEPDLRAHLNPLADSNSIIIGRVNHIDQMQVVQRIKITEDIDDIKKRLKLVKSESIQRDMDDAHIRKHYSEEMILGNFNYQRPKTIKENLKMKEDKKIRIQQEEEFFKYCQPKKQEKRQEIASIKQVEKIERMEQEVKVEEPILSIKQVSERREQKRKQLIVYQSGIGFKIRLPSGRAIILQVSGEEQVQYLFDFIESQPDDLGFINEQDRSFDIFVGFGGSETLKGKNHQKLSELFEDSEVLIVREISAD